MNVAPIALGALLLGGALAQVSSPLRLQLTQELVTTVTESGRTVEKLSSMPKSVRPGDTLTQVITASNLGKSTLRQASINLPVPRGTEFLGQSTPAGPRWSTEFSRDGGQTFAAAPLKKTITVTENGKSVQKEVIVPPSEYTNVRWVVGAMNSGDTLKFGFRVKVK
ncbi:hypothetical protein [Deinococcus koreensis]|uniref:DUF11 domain-containing protein n=1 Tax=Deinococcus koreensis TaxID=2054903 RepID=A0A2K3USN8_9DEIO|nr:hypothetical protein [Deinococcus koreensis]PNY79553.1 hypothetical protein CVO96_19195 [Deinococcus koreensis]